MTIKNWFKFRYSKVTSFFRGQKRNLTLSNLEKIAVIATLIFIYFQLRESSTQNRVSIRGQLYQTELLYQQETMNDDSLNSLWTTIPSTVTRLNFSKVLLQNISNDSLIYNAKNVEELYKLIWGTDLITKNLTHQNAKNLRKLFLYTQSIIYHLHNVYDYKKEGIIDHVEWETWKGSIREMGAHPIFLAVLYNGIKYKYFSKGFVMVVFEEICTKNPKDLITKEDYLNYNRNRDFISIFYPDFLKKDWINTMPDY